MPNEPTNEAQVAADDPAGETRTGTADRPGAVWRAEVPDLVLPGSNEIMRMKSWEYKRFRDDLYLQVRAALAPAPPAEPLARCAIRIEMLRPRRRLLDVDGKYGSVKPLLDVLQPPRTYSRPVGRLRVKDQTMGLGLIAADTDAEGGLDRGCVAELRVLQRVGDAGLRLEVVALD